MSYKKVDLTNQSSNITKLSYLKKNKILFVVDAGLAQSMVNLCTGAFLTAYAIYLGGDYLSIGILNAILCFGLIIQIPSTVIIERYPQNRKSIAVRMLTLSRILLILSGILPFALPKEYRFGSFFILYSGFVLIGNIGGCAFGAWFRDAFPPLMLYQVITNRFTISILSGAIVSLLTGVAIEIIKRHSLSLVGYAYSYTFVLSGVFGLGSSIALYLIHTKNIPNNNTNTRKLGIEMFLEPIRNITFAKILAFTALWNFLFNFINPFLPIFFLKRTEFPLLFVISLTVINQFSTALSFPVWQKYSLSFGAKSLLYLCIPLLFSSILGMVPLPFLQSQNLTISLSIILNILNGFTLGGIVLCLTNLIFQKSPEEKSTAFLALNNSISGTMAGISSISAGYLAKILNSYPLTLKFQDFCITLTGIEIIFLVSAIVGIFSTLSISFLIPSYVLKDS